MAAVHFKELSCMSLLDVAFFSYSARACNVHCLAERLRMTCSRDNPATKRFRALILDADDGFLERATLERAVVVNVLDFLAEEKDVLLRGGGKCILDTHFTCAQFLFVLII